MSNSQTSVRRVEPLALDWRSVRWNGGGFDTARRPFTEQVEGPIRTPQYLVLATLQGGARALSVRADCGHRYEGPEHAGAISIVIPDCERRLRMTGVHARWASLAIDQDTFASGMDLEGPRRHSAGSTCSTNLDDPLLFALLSEMERLHAQDGVLDASYCEAMSLAVVQHLQHRHFADGFAESRRSFGLPRWQLRRIEEYVEANLDHVIRIADLAALCGYSAAHFQRAFLRTCCRPSPRSRWPRWPSAWGTPARTILPACFAGSSAPPRPAIARRDRDEQDGPHIIRGTARRSCATPVVSAASMVSAGSLS
jgi:AraC family transcriptional regulator